MQKDLKITKILGGILSPKTMFGGKMEQKKLAKLLANISIIVNLLSIVALFSMHIMQKLIVALMRGTSEYWNAFEPYNGIVILVPEIVSMTITMILVIFGYISVLKNANRNENNKIGSLIYGICIFLYQSFVNIELYLILGRQSYSFLSGIFDYDTLNNYFIELSILSAQTHILMSISTFSVTILLIAIFVNFAKISKNDVSLGNTHYENQNFNPNYNPNFNPNYNQQQNYYNQNYNNNQR